MHMAFQGGSAVTREIDPKAGGLAPQASSSRRSAERPVSQRERERERRGESEKGRFAPPFRGAMGATCAKEIAPLDPALAAAGPQQDDEVSPGGSGSVAGSVRCEEEKSALSKDVHPGGRQSDEIHNLYDNFCSGGQPAPAQEKRRSIFGGRSSRRSFVAEGEV